MGPSTRIPALVLAPGLRGDFVVDHTQYDTTSIMATIEHRFGLPPVTSRDAAVNDLSSVFKAQVRRTITVAGTDEIGEGAGSAVNISSCPRSPPTPTPTTRPAAAATCCAPSRRARPR